MAELPSQSGGICCGQKRGESHCQPFSPGGTHTMAGEFSGINNFEVVAFLVILLEET
jgi:hypothetical protein